MPPAWALLLLAGLGGGRGCLQCDPAVQHTLRQLRRDLVPSRFGRGHLRARAQALLLGMEGPFFRDYAAGVSGGEIEADQLDPVAIFAQNQINKLRAVSLSDGPLLQELVTLRRKVTKKLKTGLRSYELKACDQKTCLDRQPRTALQYGSGRRRPWNQVLLGIVVSLCLAVFAFGVIVASAVTYRHNRKLLLQ
ncbi:izumo sperm-egg fusion protein 2 isoform X1 [Pipistrellus kuhlii]|uniref:izumo sperm-egg fusion protein 2 isoform X1 n=1 Tax=Pipistrellus kuhlii TaxID=59472 RepID=UPI001E26F50C|nr:izumo sperm-egg fusion protein 2 isoform X1 [Pipistrellus kuhlii]